MKEVNSWGDKKVSFMKLVKLICDSNENSISGSIVSNWCPCSARMK